MKTVKENPIEAVSAVIGFIIISIGIFISQVENNYGFLGDILTFLGSILASVATTWVVGRAVAKKQFSSRLDMIKGQLATTTAEISHSVSLGVDEDEDPYISLIKINQSLSNLSIVLSELDKLTESQLSLDKEVIVNAKTNILELGKSLNKFIDANKVSNNEKGRTELSKIVKQFNRAVNSLERVPVGKNVNLKSKKIPKEQIQKPDEILLARMRKLGMQFIGNNQQEIVLKAIYQEAVDNTDFRTTKEFRDDLVNKRLIELVSYKALSKSKISEILKIFFKAGAFNKRKTSEITPIEIKIKERYFEYSEFKKLHDTVFFSIAEILNIDKGHVYSILELSENYEEDFELIKSVKDRILNPENYQTEIKE